MQDKDGGSGCAAQTPVNFWKLGVYFSSNSLENAPNFSETGLLFLKMGLILHNNKYYLNSHFLKNITSFIEFKDIGRIFVIEMGQSSAANSCHFIIPVPPVFETLRKQEKHEAFYFQ